MGDPPEVPLLLTLLEKFMHWWESKNTPQNWYFGGCFFLFLILEAYRSDLKMLKVLYLCGINGKLKLKFRVVKKTSM